jgi:diacylglycerol O-acyltransferase / wax synthase
MDPVDVLLLKQENDPRRRSTITVALRLTSTPDWQRLQDRVAHATQLAPRLRYKVVSPLIPLGLPVWVDADLDVTYHVNRTRLTTAVGPAELVEHAASFARDNLDRTRPLWRILLIEPADGGPATALIKISHALMDGLAGVELLAAFVDLEPDPTLTSKDRVTGEPQMTALGLTAERLISLPWQTQVRYVRNMLGLARISSRVASRPRATTGAAWGYAGSVRRLLAAPPTAGSALLKDRSIDRRMVALEVSHDALRAAGRAAGGSLNDAYLAAVLGGVRRYHEEMGTEVAEIPFAIPISTRRAKDGDAANRFAPARFAAPVGVVDPAERIRLVQGIVSAARSEPALNALTTLAPAFAQVPTIALTFVGREQDKLDVQASNVPGPPFTGFLAGSEIDRIFAFGPLPGPAVMCVLVSYAGTCCVGFTLDQAAVTDVALFEQCAAAGFEEVLTLAPSA